MTGNIFVYYIKLGGLTLSVKLPCNEITKEIFIAGWCILLTKL